MRVTDALCVGAGGTPYHGQAERQRRVREEAVQQVVAARARKPFHQTGGAGWVLLAGLVVAWDAAAPETMSAAFRRACATPGGKAVVGLGWGILTAHLFAQLPEQADPLLYLVKAARYRRVARECAAV